ncbi:MAG: cytochrome c [Myxococcaceae bacterium]
MSTRLSRGWWVAAVLVAAPSFAEGNSAAESVAATDPQVELGGRLYKTQTCIACHSLDGSARAAPSFVGLFGKQEKLTNGQVIQVDDAYLRESILNPGAKVTTGFLPTMPPFKGRLTDAEIDALIAFIKSIR